MSKAFTKEGDGDELDLSLEAEEPDPLPGGSRNLVTPRGLELLRDELKQLRTEERPKIVEIVSWAAGNGDRSENGDYIYGKKRLHEIDRRMRYLMKRIDSAKLVDPKLQTNHEQVFFGASVTYADVEDLSDAAEKTIRIVGVDEAETDRGEVSWISPIARALLKARVGDTVSLRSPGGERQLEVIAIEYKG